MFPSKLQSSRGQVGDSVLSAAAHFDSGVRCLFSERRAKTMAGCFQRSTTIRASHSSNQLPVHWGKNSLSKFQADDLAALAVVRCNYFSGS